MPDGASTALAPYIHEQMKFFVAKVDITKVHRDELQRVVLSPLRVSYDSDELRLPVRLGLLNANGKQDLIVYTLHPTSRFEVANYKNIFIPTNLDVADGVRNAFGSFYAELFDAALAQAGGKAIVTEYAWQSTSCDPCPTPVLDASELATLGVDVAQLPGAAYGGVVLTRMHARYDKDTLSDDLIFREAPPVMGGRAQWNGTSADAGAATQGAYGNNFQGRYIIRHYWQGAVTCSHPVYDNWGGPPNGRRIKRKPRAIWPTRRAAESRSRRSSTRRCRRSASRYDSTAARESVMKRMIFVGVHRHVDTVSSVDRSARFLRLLRLQSKRQALQSRLPRSRWCGRAITLSLTMSNDYMGPPEYCARRAGAGGPKRGRQDAAADDHVRSYRRAGRRRAWSNTGSRIRAAPSIFPKSLRRNADALDGGR